MRKPLVILSTFALLAIAFPVRAEQKELLGQGNVALKVGLGVFTSDFLESVDHTTFLELEGYYRITPNIYLGGNIGTTFIGEDVFSLFTKEINYYPVELNVKYAKELGARFVIDGGGGVSFNYATIRINNVLTPDYDESDWLLGGQVFADLICKFNWFSIGIYGKYQMTQDFRDLDADFSNWRGGLQVGVIF